MHDVLHRRTSEDVDKIPVQDCYTLFLYSMDESHVRLHQLTEAGAVEILGWESFKYDSGVRFLIVHNSAQVSLHITA